uniref:GTP-binding protein n=1 Tax=Chromobacterium piscinae TaxID=686831 RepID=UPI003908071C
MPPPKRQAGWRSCAANTCRKPKPAASTVSSTARGGRSTRKGCGSGWAGVVRSKGYFWLASRPQFATLWSQAGAVARHSCAGLWRAASEEETEA